MNIYKSTLKSACWICFAFCFAWIPPCEASTLGKLHAKSCNGDSRIPTFQSTALLFAKGQEVYALAPEAKTYFDREGNRYCHEITIPSGVSASESRFSATILASNWAQGLALLKLEHPSSELLSAKLPEPLEQPEPGATFSILGFGSEAGVSAISTQARLLALRSDRHAFALWDTAAELLGGPIQTTQVGGLVVDQTGRWVGLVSSQYLRLQAGGPALLLDWDENTAHKVQHLIMLTARQVLAFLDEALGPTSRDSGFSVVPEDRAGGIQRLQLGDLIFSLSCPPKGDEQQPYYEGYPIGGADGVGIGGSYSTGVICKTLVTLAPKSSAWPFARLSPWHDRLLAQLKAHPEARAEIWYLTRLDTLTDRAVARAFGSLAELWTDLLRSDFAPVTTVTLAGSRVPGLEPELTPVREKAFAIEQQVIARLNEHLPPLTSEALALLQRIFFHMKLLESDQEARATPSELLYLGSTTGNLKSSWDAILKDSSAASDMPAELRELVQLLGGA